MLKLSNEHQGTASGEGFLHRYIQLISRCQVTQCHWLGTMDSLSLSTKHKLQRKLKPNVTQISQPMTDEGVANSPLMIGFHN